MPTPEARLLTRGLVLPTPAPPVAAYAPVVLHQGAAHVSGQLPRADGTLIVGRVGDGITVAAARAAAERCAEAVLAVLRQALAGDLDRVERCLQLTGYVCATADFTQHSEVVNGASELMADIFGAAGAHARAAVGVASLPFGVPVEVSAVFAVRP